MSNSSVHHATLVLVALIAFVLFTVLLYAYQRYQKISQSVANFKKHIAMIFPEIQHTKYHHIQWHDLPTHRAREIQIETANSSGTPAFDAKIARTLCSCIMSAYNLYMKYDPLLDGKVSIIAKIGNNGALFKMATPSGSSAYIYAFRGTMSKSDILTDLTFSQVPFVGRSYQPTKAKVLVHKGFYTLWKAHLDEIVNSIPKEENATIYVTGHSMGASLAAFTALEIAKTVNRPPIVYLFAPPRAGNQIFTQEFATAIPHHWAHINVRDLVCEIPPSICPTMIRSCIYDDYKNVYRSDCQTGSYEGNHHLETYAELLDGDVANHPLWTRKSQIVCSE